MVLYLLCIKADLENISSIKLPPGYSYCIDVKESAGTESREGVYVSAAEEEEVPNSRGTANFIIKFAKDSRKAATINVVDVKGVTREYTGDDEGAYVPIIGFDCRGVEPIGFHPESGWIVRSRGGKLFDDVDLREKEWADFDDDAGESVGIYALESMFRIEKQ